MSVRVRTHDSEITHDEATHAYPDGANHLQVIVRKDRDQTVAVYAANHWISVTIDTAASSTQA